MNGSANLSNITLEEIRGASETISSVAIRTPLVKLGSPQDGTTIYLKLECLQPIGSFKIRGSANAILSAPPQDLLQGVFTASAGNMAQGIAWNARVLGLPATAVVPDHAPETKVKAIEHLGGRVIRAPFSEWWEVVQSRKFESLDGLFVHPFAERSVIAGNGTVALEILEDLPEVDSIIVPFGGGGLVSGIASATHALNGSVRVIASEVETSAAYAAAVRFGAPTTINYIPSFVDGIGSARVSDEMWPLVSELIDGSVVVSIEDTRAAIRKLAMQARVVAEGAGASSLAAALSGRAGTGNIVCVVSGGNIDSSVFSEILSDL